MCGNMVDIQSAAAEIRRGKKIEEEMRKKPQGKNIMACPITQGGHKKKQNELNIVVMQTKSACRHIITQETGLSNSLAVVRCGS